MKIRVDLGRSIREYCSLIVEADSVEAAEAYCERLLASDGTSQEYCDLVNAGHWESQSDSVSDEEVIGIEEYDDEEEEPDVIVPAGKAGLPTEN